VSVDLITLIGTTGTRVVPDPASYSSVSPDWTEEEFRAFELADGSLGGLWCGEPGRVSFDSWPYTEVCVIISGHIAIEDESGRRRDFHGGAAFVIPQGFRGTWITVQETEKIFVGICGSPETQS
jgi:uncharacterized cupin superfamily protein